MSFPKFAALFAIIPLCCCSSPGAGYALSFTDGPATGFSGKTGKSVDISRPPDGPGRGGEGLFSTCYGPGGFDYREGPLARFMQKRKNGRTAVTFAAPAPPPAVEVRVPVILVEYPDEPSTVSADDIDEYLFGSGSSPNMTDYYEEVSYGRFSVRGDVYGPYEVSTDYADYTAADREDFITEVIGLADGDVDFSRYDADGDGYVDGVLVVESRYFQVLGYETAHCWSIPDYTTDDGATVSVYTAQQEDTSVGIFCHEFGHVLGLPDLYSGGSGQYYSISYWGLMGTGCNLDPPAHLSAWSKIDLGWVEPIEITESVDDQPIANVEESGEIYKLFIDGLDKTEYLLVENRQPIGSDAGLPGDGLLVWHVGYNDIGTSYYDNVVVLASSSRGKPDDAYGDDRDPFPGSADVREYLDETYGIEISDISDSGSTMTADFTIPRSIDGWRFQESGTTSDLRAVRFADVDTGWAAGDGGIILYTSDGGETWEAQESGTTADLAALCAADSSTAWAVGASGTILHTSNGGATWEIQDSGVGEDLNSVSFIDVDRGWALSDVGTLLTTSDGGGNWENESIGNGDEKTVGVRFATEKYGFIAGENQTLFYSADGGDSWGEWTGVSDELSSSTIEISRLCVLCDNDMWLLGNSDRAYLIWIWEGYVAPLWLSDYKKLADLDFSDKLGIAAGDRLVVLRRDSRLGFGLGLFSLHLNDCMLDGMDWVEVEEWSDSLTDAPLAVDAVSNRVGYVVGENGLILRYNRVMKWSAIGDFTPFTGLPVADTAGGGGFSSLAPFTGGVSARGKAPERENVSNVIAFTH